MLANLQRDRISGTALAAIMVATLAGCAALMFGLLWWSKRNHERTALTHPDAWLAASVVVAGLHLGKQSLLLDSVGLTVFTSRGRPHQRGTVPWPAIISAEPTRILYGARVYPGLRVTFTDLPPLELFAATWFNADQQMNQRVIELVNEHAGSSKTPQPAD